MVSGMCRIMRGKNQNNISVEVYSSREQRFSCFTLTAVVPSLRAPSDTHQTRDPERFPHTAPNYVVPALYSFVGDNWASGKERPAMTDMMTEVAADTHRQRSTYPSPSMSSSAPPVLFRPRTSPKCRYPPTEKLLFLQECATDGRNVRCRCKHV